MKKVSIFFYSSFIFYLSNFILYIFNLTNFLFFKDIHVVDNLLNNFFALFLYLTTYEVFVYLLFKKIILKLNKSFYYLIISIINFIILTLILKFGLNFSSFNHINNVLSLFFSIFLTTNVFYYSIYFSSLLE